MQKVNTDWKVYTPGGEYTAATKYPVEAAMLVSALGDGAQIKYMHHTLVWTEGKEQQRADESYDHVAEVCLNRVNETRLFVRALNALRDRSLRFRDNLDDVKLIADAAAKDFGIEPEKLYTTFVEELRKRKG